MDNRVWGKWRISKPNELHSKGRAENWHTCNCVAKTTQEQKQKHTQIEKEKQLKIS